MGAAAGARFGFDAKRVRRTAVPMTSHSAPLFSRLTVYTRQGFPRTWRSQRRTISRPHSVSTRNECDRTYFSSESWARSCLPVSSTRATRYTRPLQTKRMGHAGAPPANAPAGMELGSTYAGSKTNCGRSPACDMVSPPKKAGFCGRRIILENQCNEVVAA